MKILIKTVKLQSHFQQLIEGLSQNKVQAGGAVLTEWEHTQDLGWWEALGASWLSSQLGKLGGINYKKKISKLLTIKERLYVFTVEKTSNHLKQTWSWEWETMGNYSLKGGWWDGSASKDECHPTMQAWHPSEFHPWIPVRVGKDNWLNNAILWPQHIHPLTVINCSKLTKWIKGIYIICTILMSAP